MLTHNHGLLAYWFNKFLNHRLKTKVHPIYIIIGAILPDIFLIFNFIFRTSVLVTISKGFHSILIFTIVFICYFLLIFLPQGLNYGRVTAFFLGWGIFHIAIDLMTHKSKAWPYLWPWIDSPIHGMADHYNPILLGLEIILTVYFLYRLLILVVSSIRPAQKTP